MTSASWFARAIASALLDHKVLNTGKICLSCFFEEGTIYKGPSTAHRTVLIWDCVSSIFEVMGTEPGASHRLGKRLTTESDPRSCD